MYSDDDANSDASSACSECSYSSRNGSIPHYLRQTEDVAEILNHCASSNWSERKEGLLGLQSLLKSQRILRWDSCLQAAHKSGGGQRFCAGPFTGRKTVEYVMKSVNVAEQLYRLLFTTVE